MSDPTWASVFGALRARGEISFGVALGLLVCALFVRFLSKRRSARKAALGLGAAAAFELGAGALVRFLPLVSVNEEPSPERDAALAAAFQRVELAAFVLLGLALVCGVVCFRRPTSVRFALLVASLGVVGQTVWVEVGVREYLAAIQSRAKAREVERRAIAKCLEAQLAPSGSTSDSLAASLLADAPVALGVDRVWVRRQRVFDSFPYHCLVSASDAWCFGYSTSSTDALEKLVREYPFTSATRELTDAAVADWVAFALGVYVWQPSSTRSPTDGQATPARVERNGERMHIDFWERHPLIPGFGVQLRHADVLLDGRSVTVTRGPMTETLRPDWDRDSL